MKFLASSRACLEIRTELKLSQNELARKLGHSTGQMISNIERALAPMPLKSFKRAVDRLTKDPKQRLELKRKLFNARLLDEIRLLEKQVGEKFWTQEL